MCSCAHHRGDTGSPGLWFCMLSYCILLTFLEQRPIKPPYFFTVKFYRQLKKGSIIKRETQLHNRRNVPPNVWRLILFVPVHLLRNFSHWPPHSSFWELVVNLCGCDTIEQRIQIWNFPDFSKKQFLLSAISTSILHQRFSKKKFFRKKFNNSFLTFVLERKRMHLPKLSKRNYI